MRRVDSRFRGNDEEKRSSSTRPELALEDLSPERIPPGPVVDLHDPEIGVPAEGPLDISIGLGLLDQAPLEGGKPTKGAIPVALLAQHPATQIPPVQFQKDAAAHGLAAMEDGGPDALNAELAQMGLEPGPGRQAVVAHGNATIASRPREHCKTRRTMRSSRPAWPG